MTVAMKFGGSSVADADAIKRVASIVERQRAQSAGAPSPVVVVSALGGVTDRLIEAARLAEEGDGAHATAVLHALFERHVAVATALTAGAAQAQLVAKIRDEFDELIGLVHALAVLHEVSPRSLDAVLAAGEVVSSRIVAAALTSQKIPAVWIDARTIVVTDVEHTAALPDMGATRERVSRLLAPVVKRGEVAVLGGFIGATPNGVTTTLGRGGSDYSAAIVGACLDVDEIQIWTDVDGMLTADPRIVPQPAVVPRLSFAEASELAYFGAKVLHPSTILPAVSNNIPVRIVNSRRPDNPGTLITADVRQPAGGLTAIACKRDVTVIDITSTRMLMAHGFLRRVFEVFERFKTAVDVVTTSEVSVSVTVDDVRRLDAIVDNLKNFAEVGIEPEMAIVCIVGENLRSDPTLFSRSVTALDRIPLRLVSQAASRRNITFVLRDSDVTAAMGRLHEEFFRAPAAYHDGTEHHDATKNHETTMKS
ncbi:MAG TPA: lysine-sensitive aspartokinase 3 [Vicinamibacterales bacterium]